jgi:hypothetical protein
MARKLGKTQAAVLKCLQRHGRYYPGCGWYWNNTSGTIRILESLVRRGLVVKDPDLDPLKVDPILLTYFPVKTEEE